MSNILKGISLKALIVGIIFVVVLNFFVGLPNDLVGVGYPGSRTFSFSWLLWNAMPKMFLAFMILLGVNAIAGKNIFNKKEVFLIIWMISYVGVNNVYTSNFNRALPGALRAAADDYTMDTNYMEIGALGNGFWGPLSYKDDPEVAYNTIMGPVPVDFGSWMLPIMWNTFFHTFFALMLLFVQMIFTQPLVIAEDLPVPGVEMYSELTEMTQTIDVKDVEGKSKGRGKLAILTRKWLWLGFIIGFIVGAPFLLTNPTWIPENPSIVTGQGGFGDYNNAWGWYNIRGIYEEDYSRTVGIVGANFLMSFHPYLIAWGLIWPWDILLPFFFAMIFMNFIIGPVFVNAGIWSSVGPWGNEFIRNGMYGGVTRTGAGGWTQPAGQTVPPGFGYFAIIGMAIAIIIYPIWRARNTMGPVLKALIAKPPKEVDDKSPVPYQMAWIGMIVMMILTVALGSAAGYSAAPLLLYTLIMIFFSIAIGRVFVEGSYLGWSDTGWNKSGSTGGLGIIASSPPLSMAIGHEMQNTGDIAVVNPQVYADIQLYSYWHKPSVEAAMTTGIWAPLYGLKLADMYGQDKKSWFKMALIVPLITFLAISIGTIYFLHVASWGSVENNWYGRTLAGHGWNVVTRDNVYLQIGVYIWGDLQPYLSGIIGTLVIFALIGFGMYIMREKISWLNWWNPVGWYIGMGVFTGGTWHAFSGSIFWPTLCIVVRYLAMKVKGPAWTKKTMTAIGVGILLGFIVSISIPSFFQIFHQYGLFGWARSVRVDNP
jgi:hypothetical protein